MKCIACGREMKNRGTHYECSNILCDYVEDIIDHKELWARLKQERRHCNGRTLKKSQRRAECVSIL